MLFPAISTLRTEDYPSEQKWISRLFSNLNPVIISLGNILNGNVTLGDNIPCQTFSLSFTYAAATDFPKQVKWSLSQNQLGSVVSPPIEVRLCSALENGVGIAVVHAWQYANGQINFPYVAKITTTGISALTVGAKYNFVFRGQI